VSATLPSLTQRSERRTAEPVRVLHVITSLGRQAGTGGTEYGIIKLVNGLERCFVRSAVCSTFNVHPEIARLLAPDVRLFQCGRRTSGNDPRLLFRLWRCIRQFRPHIVHTHGWGTLCEGLLASSLARVPRLVHGEHGTLQVRPDQVLVQRWAWRRADRLLAVSSRLAEGISRQTGFPAHAIRVIRNGVDLDRFGPHNRAAGRAALGLEPSDIVIGTVGRLVPVKNQQLFVRALAALQTRGLRVRGFIVGNGPLRAELEREVEACGLTGHVEVLHHRRDIEVVMSAFDVFVLSSISEGLSNTIQEAMACGVPVVATNVGGADELVRDGVDGTLVPSEDLPALASAVERLVLDAGIRRRMGEAARTRAEQEFSLARMIDDYQDVYVRLANGTASRSGQLSVPGAELKSDSPPS
jgi:sugar transferase (PEP-CTERM/EpsH1 system associated)